MSFDANAITDALVSMAASSGLFITVNGHEPVSAPATGGVTAALWLQAIGPAKKVSGLADTAGRVEFLMRLYQPLVTGGNFDLIEPEMANAAAQMIGLLSADFTLGGEIFAADLLGAHGTPLSSRARYLDQGGQNFRIIDITIPLLVDDVWTQAP